MPNLAKVRDLKGSVKVFRQSTSIKRVQKFGNWLS